MSSGYGGRRIRVAVVGTGMIAGVHARAARAAGRRGRRGARADAVPLGAGRRTARRAPRLRLARRGDRRRPRRRARLHAERPAPPAVDGGDPCRHQRRVREALAISAEQAAELVAAADEAGVVATVPFVYRYHPAVREIRGRIAAGELGRLLAVHGHYLQDWMLDEDASSWRVDAGAGGVSRAFADIGSHWCDLVEFVTGEPFRSVSAATDIVYPTARRRRPVVLRLAGPRPGRRLRAAGRGDDRGHRGRHLPHGRRTDRQRRHLAGRGGTEEPAVVRGGRHPRFGGVRPGAARDRVVRQRARRADRRPRPVAGRAGPAAPGGRAGRAPAGVPRRLRGLRRRHLRRSPCRG